MLSIKHLNTDASFLLTFEPLVDADDDEAPPPRPYHVLLDPWLVGSSKILHSKISLTRHTEPACVSSLRQLPEPDLVIISQAKSDHCNEATLKQLPPASKALILAEPAAARIIQGWKHFDRRKVLTLAKWEDQGPPPKGKRGAAGGGGGSNKHASRHAVTRIPLPPAAPGGEPGEVTVAFIPQKRDLTGLHAAIGVTFRSAPRKDKPTTTMTTRSSAAAATAGSFARTPNSNGVFPPCVTFPLTPPATPKSHRSYPNLPTLYAAAGGSPHALYPPPPPPPPAPLRLLSDGRDVVSHYHHAPTEESRVSLPPPPVLPPLLIPRSPTPTIRSARSCSTLTPTNTISSTLSAAATLTTPTTAATATSPTSFLTPPFPNKNNNHLLPPIATTTSHHPRRRPRTLSVLFSPHGIPYQGNLESYATTHLINEAALPLTALLHCFDAVRNPWWLGGDVVLGAPAGRDIAVKLHARCWLSCHDGDKDVRGLATGWVKTRRWDRDVLERAVTGPGRDVADVFGQCGNHNTSSPSTWGSSNNNTNKVATRKKITSRGPQPVAAATGEKKLELRRVGSKLRLWPSPPPSSSLSRDDYGMNGTGTGTHNNKIVEQEQKPKRREAPPPAAQAAAAAANAVEGMADLLAPGKAGNKIQGTQVIDLASGEMVVLTSDGPWNVFRGQVVPL